MEAYGAHIGLPSRLQRHPRDETAFVDQETQVGWWVFAESSPRLCLDEEGWDDLREHVAYYAHSMFMTSPEARARHGARTDDPTWSPLVELEKRGDVLHLVHRMAYEPGRELVMGHRLLQTAKGLVEVRVAAHDQTTGVRESMLTLASATRGEAPTPLSQAAMDAPEHDARFPAHALSRVRAALEEVTLEALEPAVPLTRGEIELSRVGVALVPPPRFAYVGEHETGDWFGRTSFCVTDGVEHFGVALCPGRVDRASLARRGAELGRSLLVRHDGREVSAEVVDENEHGAFVHVDGMGHAGRLTQVYGFFATDDGRWGYAAILGSDAVPASRRVEDLRACLATIRLLPSGPATKKPFWKLW